MHAAENAEPSSAQEQTPSFDIFVQNSDLRWCLLVRCDYASLSALRQLSEFRKDVPSVLSSREWCASPTHCVALHTAQWSAGGGDVLHKSLSQPVGETVVQLRCTDDNARRDALAHGAQRNEAGDPVLVVKHPVGLERMISAAQLAAIAGPLAPFLRDPLEHTTTIVAGATHSNGAVQTVSVALDAIIEQGMMARGVRAYRSRYLVASGGRDGISRVSSVAPTACADGLRAVPLSIQGALRHGGQLSAVEVQPSGVLLSACSTSTMMRVYELEAAHLAAARIAAAGMPANMVPT